MLLGSLTVYAVLFGTGYWLYGQRAIALTLLAVAAGASVWLLRLWGGVSGNAANVD